MLNQVSRISKLAWVFGAMTVYGSVALALRMISFGYLLEFNRKYFIPISGKLTMRVIGIKLDLPRNIIPDDGNYFVTFNHNSYLDGFALTCLGLTRTTFLLSEKMIKVFPVTVASLAIGIIYIPQKKNKERRLKFFEKLEARVMKNKVNIAGSSEGVHPHIHGIAPFNKGVYHMATICRMKIIPLFISVPKESNPFDDYANIKKGTIKVEVMDIINTTGWQLEDLDSNKNQVRDLYVKRFNKEHKTQVA